MNTKPKTIDMTPTWEETANMLIVLFERGNPEGIETAKAELIKMGKALDGLLEYRQANKEIADALIWCEQVYGGEWPEKASIRATVAKAKLLQA